MAKRSHNDAFLKLAFIELDGKPKHLVCLKVLSTESIKQNKLQCHLERNHPNCYTSLLNFLSASLNRFKQRNVMTAFTTKNILAVYSSYVASYQIANKKKAHTIGEDLLMPVMKEVVK